MVTLVLTANARKNVWHKNKREIQINTMKPRLTEHGDEIENNSLQNEVNNLLSVFRFCTTLTSSAAAPNPLRPE